MRVIIIPPAFAPYADESPFSTIYLCQMIGSYLQSIGWQIELLGIKGSTSKHFKAHEFPGAPQPSIIDLDFQYATNKALSSIISFASEELLANRCDAVLNFGHDVLPYSMNMTGMLNVVTFSRGIEPSIDRAICDGQARHQQNFGFISSSQAAGYGATSLSPLYCPVTSAGNPVVTTGGQVLFAGRVTRSKGVMNALELADRTGFELLIAGQHSSDSPGELECAPNAKLLGCLNRQSLFRTMRESSALIQLQACDVNEAFGMVTAEALCNGLPVVTWACGANTELVTEEDGVIVPAGDIEAAARATREVASWGVEKRKAIQERALSRFSIESVGGRYRRWIESCAQ